MKYYPFELHSHTVHSDGRMTPRELIGQAETQMLSGIAITDHNTAAAHRELLHSDVRVIRGMEWTTFYGHFLVIGSEHEGRWRKASPETMGGHISELNRQGMALGIAHPFSVGGVLRTGAHWEYPMDADAWGSIHYMEVFSGISPHLNGINIPARGNFIRAQEYKRRFEKLSQENHLENLFVPEYKSAFKKWTELLNKGFHIAATSGRDWHAPHVPGQHAAVTYLGIEGEISTASVISALRAGRSYVTLGPCVNFSAEKNGEAGEYTLTLETFRDGRYAVWKEFGVEISDYRIIHNGEAIVRGETGIRGTARELSSGWLRGEIYGKCPGEPDESLLAFTSPVYI